MTAYDAPFVLIARIVVKRQNISEGPLKHPETNDKEEKSPDLYAVLRILLAVSLLIILIGFIFTGEF
jgi:hypothetical protein